MQATCKPAFAVSELQHCFLPAQRASMDQHGVMAPTLLKHHPFTSLHLWTADGHLTRHHSPAHPQDLPSVPSEPGPLAPAVPSPGNVWAVLSEGDDPWLDEILWQCQKGGGHSHALPLNVKASTSEPHRPGSIFAGARPYSHLHDIPIAFPMSLYLHLSVFSPSSSHTSRSWCNSSPFFVPKKQLTPVTALVVPLRTGHR